MQSNLNSIEIMDKFPELLIIIFDNYFRNKLVRNQITTNIIGNLITKAKSD